MATPTEKNPVIEEMLTTINGGRSRKAYIYANVCVKCEGDARLFADAASRKEFAISGWCQHCQDEMFDDTATEGM